jgi:hypothetical protein
MIERPLSLAELIERADGTARMALRFRQTVGRLRSSKALTKCSA